MDYTDISEAIIPYLQVSETVYTQCPPEARQLFYDQAFERYEIVRRNTYEPPPQFEVSFEQWTERVQSANRVFYGDDGQWHRFLNFEVIARGNDIVLTPNTFQSVVDYIETLREKYRTSLKFPYMATLSINNDIHINVRGEVIDIDIANKLEEYNDVPLLFNSVTIRYSDHSQLAETRAHFRPGSGEGISRYLGNGFWSFEIYPTKTKCVMNAYLAWTYYKDHILDEFIQLPKATMRTLQKKLLDTLDKKAPHSFISMPSIPHVIIDISELSKLIPQDTIDKCIYFCSNFHASLIIHESQISHSVISAMKSKENIACLSQINIKQPAMLTSPIIAADIESHREHNNDEFVHIPLILGEESEDHRVQYIGDNCLEEYFDHLQKSHDNHVIWFHNGGKYDIHLLLQQAVRICDSQLTHPIVFFDVNGRLLEMTVKTKHGKVSFRDSYALIPAPLNKLAKDMNCEGKLPNVDIVNVTREDLLTNPLYHEYNTQDCRSLLAILTKYRDSNIKLFGTDPLYQVSASSYAKRIFFSRYYIPEQYPLYNLTEKCHRFIDKSYGGGRNEMYIRGHISKSLHLLDFTSYYPWAGTQALPYGIFTWIDNLKIKDVDSWLRKNPGFYEVTILVSPMNKIPLHGIKRDFKYIFPYMTNVSGEIFFSEELIYGIGLGYEYKLHRGYKASLGAYAQYFFSDLFHIKQQAAAKGATGETLGAKITVNSGYGSFGFNKFDRLVMSCYGKHEEAHLIAAESMGLTSYMKYGNVFIARENKNVLLNDVNVAVSAAITSYARIRLHKLIQQVTDMNFTVYYCDTDSIITDCPIEKLSVWIGDNNGSELGGLKHECDIDEAVFVGCKTYGYRSGNVYVAKSKGTRLHDIANSWDPEESESSNAYLKRVNNEKNKVMFNILISLLDHPSLIDVNTISTSRSRKIRHDLTVRDKILSKEISGIYTKGLVNEFGRVLPLHLKSD